MKHYLTKLEETIRSHWSQPALCDYGGDIFTYGDIAKYIKIFHSFFEKSGIAKGDKIAICAKNSARWAITFWAVNTYEAVTVPLLADFHPDNIVYLVNHSDSTVLFTDKNIWRKLNQTEMPALKMVFDMNDHSLLWSSDTNISSAWNHPDIMLHELCNYNLNPQDVCFPIDNESELAIINYTSGTTSSPKGVMLTYGAISDTDEFCNTQFPNKPGETVVSMLPLAHMYGLGIEFIHPNVDGVTIYFLGKTPSPTLLLKAMQDVKPYMVVTVPLVMEKIYANSIRPALERLKMPLSIPGIRTLLYDIVRKKILKSFGGNVRCFIMGGAPLKSEVERCFKRIGLPFTVGYGMTEACPLLCWEWWTEFVPGSCGKPVHEIRIDSKDPLYIAGEIQTRGANITIGYYKNPEANAAAFTEDGWFRTGDLGIMDIDGNVFIRGRIKSMILNSSGQNIYPEEIEAILSECPYVAESIVVDRNGKIVALVYPVDFEEMDEETRLSLPEQIREMVNKSLPCYSQISKIELKKHPFEKTPKMSIKRDLYK